MTTAIVVTYQSEAVIAECLESLRGLRVVVVDNGSTDRTRDLVAAAAPDEFVKLDANTGFAGGVNRGLAAAGRDDVLLVNPDVRVEPGSVAALEAVLAAHPRTGVVAPRLLHADRTPQPSVRRFKTPAAVLARRSPWGRTARGAAVLARDVEGPVSSDEPVDVDWAIGAALLVRRAAIDEIGGMDEGFFLYEEDQDWCIRMWRAGWAVRFQPDAVMVHAYQRASRRSFALWQPTTRYHWASLTRFYGKYPQLLAGRSPV